jgi:alkaline phosphatase
MAYRQSLALFFVTLTFLGTTRGEDHLRQLQTAAVQSNHADVAHWGYDRTKYTLSSSHTNRLIPIYTFGTRGAGKGVDLDSYMMEHSPYRSEESVRRIYGFLPEHTVSETADYMDQTNVYDLQVAAAAAGKKHIFLVVFDGMDWDTTRAAAIFNSKRVPYDSGRGTGTHMQDYTANGTSQFGFMVTSPHNEGTTVDVNGQRVVNSTDVLRGGYDPVRAGPNPWTHGNDPQYLVSLPKSASDRHAYTDSSCSASSMTTGIKSYNGAVNVDPLGRPVPTIAHQLQQRGWAVGAVTSVPVSHATPAAAYAHNVERDDYQDISRDMLGLPSISHPNEAVMEFRQRPSPHRERISPPATSIWLTRTCMRSTSTTVASMWSPNGQMASLDRRV